MNNETLLIVKALDNLGWRFYADFAREVGGSGHGSNFTEWEKWGGKNGEAIFNGKAVLVWLDNRPPEPKEVD